MTYAANGGIFTGNLWLDRYVSGALTGERDVGNARLFTLSAPTVEQKEKLSKRIESFGETLETKIMKNQRKLKISLDDVAGDFKDNLVLAMFGEDSVVTVTGAAVPAESITAYLGKGSKLAKKNVATSPAIVVKAQTPAAWAADTGYELGDFVLAGDYRAECTVAGDSHETTEPTWPEVVGQTIVDNEVTWTIRKLTYIVNVDYEVSTTGAVTHIIPLSTGGITAGQTLSVAYTHGTYSGYSIEADAATQIDVLARLVGKNINNDDDVEVVVFKARLKPTSDLEWIVDDFVALELEGEILSTDDGTWTVEVLNAA